MPDPAAPEPDYEGFAAEVREFARSQCPEDIRRLVAQGRKLDRAPLSRWQTILFERGWGAPKWPVEFGGTGWDVRQQFIFEEVLVENDCPLQHHHGLRQIGPVIMEFGSPEQKARYLPRILSGEEWWCQGYSEPGAGSDLAALSTSAVRDGDEYVVNGHKTWTSYAHQADMMYTLVRTSVEDKKQKGISLLLIPLDSPGLEIQPIATIDGWHHVNEVFLRDVRVPAGNLVGAEGQGWSYGKFLLGRERLGAANTAPIRRLLERTRGLVRRELAASEFAGRRQALLARLISIESEIAGVREMSLRAVDDVMAGKPLGTAASVLKVASSRLFQEISEVALEVLGPAHAARFARHDDDDDREGFDEVIWLQNYLFMRVRTIYGGSNEVQKNVIAADLFPGIR